MIWTPRSIAGRLIPGLVFAAWLAAAPAAAQNTGTISGTIIDNTGQVVPGATITLTNEATADARTAPSGGHGEFAFRGVEPGSYTVRVELTGFRTHQQKGNVLNASGTLDLGNVKLDLARLPKSFPWCPKAASSRRRTATIPAC